MEKMGKNPTRIRATMRAAINGSIFGTILLIGMPVMEDVTNRFAATGGVMKAMHRANTIVMPKWTGSIP